MSLVIGASGATLNIDHALPRQNVTFTVVHADGSTAAGVGFQKGDIIVSVNNQKIAKPADLDRIAGAGGHQWRITFTRGGQQISVMFTG